MTRKNRKILAWVVLIWSILRSIYFLFSGEPIEIFGESTTWFYIIYFGLVIWFAIDCLKEKIRK